MKIVQHKNSIGNISSTIECHCELGSVLEASGLEAMVQAFDFTRPPSIRIETAPGQAAMMGSTVSDWQAAAIGQSNLTVSPLQVARAFGAILGDGYLPTLHIVSAVKDMHGRWKEIDPLGERVLAIQSEVSDKIREALTDDSDSFFSYSARAITGSEEQSLSWFVCSNMADPDSVRLVLVVLENATELHAKAIGLSLIDW